MGVSIFNTGYDLQDQIDAAESAIAIVSIGSTHAAITSGQYVYVREHGTLAEGLYRATANIAANGTLSGSNVTAVSGGGLNALNSKVKTYDLGDLSSLSDLQTAITTYANGNMADNQSQNIVFKALFTDSFFTNGSVYVGILARVSTQNRFSVIIHNHISQSLIRATCASGTWAWDSLALNSNVVPKDNLIVQSMKKITESSAGTIKFTFTGNRYTALLFKTDNLSANSGIYAIDFKQASQANVVKIIGSTTLPTIDADGSISIAVNTWSRVTLMTDAIAEFS